MAFGSSHGEKQDGSRFVAMTILKKMYRLPCKALH